jgi:hypothetical protein
MYVCMHVHIEELTSGAVDLNAAALIYNGMIPENDG